MSPLFGEFDCTLDAKGRFLLPAALLRQLPPEQQEAFVLNRGLDPCLVLYPLEVWQTELAKIHAKNQYVADNRAFARLFQNGATPVELDSAKRVLIPRRLAEAVGIEKDLVLIGSYDRIEVWGQQRYQAWLLAEGHTLEKLSETVMGNDALNRVP